jgi:hypothetical protein
VADRADSGSFDFSFGDINSGYTSLMACINDASQGGTVRAETDAGRKRVSVELCVYKLVHAQMGCIFVFDHVYWMVCTKLGTIAIGTGTPGPQFLRKIGVPRRWIAFGGLYR